MAKVTGIGGVFFKTTMGEGHPLIVPISRALAYSSIKTPSRPQSSSGSDPHCQTEARRGGSSGSLMVARARLTHRRRDAQDTR